ncbi:MAG: Rieske (2Fe-2S) protein [Planctomycetota bacterium]|nr:Rieske (2Fe-2S) protein [Planctomycetota bacterium]
MSEEISRRQALAWLSRAAVAGCVLAQCDLSAEEKPAGKAAPVNLKDFKDVPKGRAFKPELQEVILVQTEKGVAAFPALCTHKNNNMVVDKDDGIFCPSHGSIFNLDGTVKKGPARGPLKWLKVTVDKDGNVSVDPKTFVKAGDWTAVPAKEGK